MYYNRVRTHFGFGDFMKGSIFKLLNRSELYPLGVEDSLT